jgi:hypothetical protein
MEKYLNSLWESLGRITWEYHTYYLVTFKRGYIGELGEVIEMSNLRL